MSHRFSRSEKGKMISVPHNQTKRKPVIIPASNTEALIEDNKVRVRINGLRPLDMTLDTVLPSGGTKKVELHFEKLEKHCFSCHSLTHEDSDCPQNRAPRNHRSDYKGINHAQTLESLDAHRKAKDDRKEEKNRSAVQPRRDVGYQAARSSIDTRRYGNNSKSPPRVSHLQSRHNRSSLGASKDSRHYAHFHENPLASHRISRSQRPPQDRINVHSRLGDRVWVEKSSNSQVSHTPPPKPPREALITSQEVSSLSRRPMSQRLEAPEVRETINEPNPSRGSERLSALQRIESPINRPSLPLSGNLHVSSQDRLPALQRLALPRERVPLLQNGVANSDSGRLQEVEIQYLEDTFPTNLLDNSGNPSSSRPPARERLSLPQVSPIRSLSEDRRQLELTVPHLEMSEEADPSYQLPTESTRMKKGKVTTTKAAGKRKAMEKLQPIPKRRVVKSPRQVASTKIRRVTKTQNSPRRKLMADSIAARRAGI
ncbi:hypothetical protein IGI04_011348, partial [Brassica rapa subsp. trilocularis]